MDQHRLEEGWFYHNHAWYLLHEIIKLIREVDCSILLDYGAGTGVAASCIKAMLPDLFVQVCDINPVSKKYWDKRGLNGFVIKEDEKIKSEYDVIISSHVVEHIESPRDVIINLFEKTRKRLIIAVPEGDLHMKDHKIIFNRSFLEFVVRDALVGKDFKYRSFPVYHHFINNLIAVIDK